MPGGKYFSFEEEDNTKTFKFDAASEELKEAMQSDIMDVLATFDEVNSKLVLKAGVMLNTMLAVQIALHSKDPRGAGLALWCLKGIAMNFDKYEEFSECGNAASEAASRILSNFLTMKIAEIYNHAGEEHFLAAVRQWSERLKEKGHKTDSGPSGFDFKKAWGI